MGNVLRGINQLFRFVYPTFFHDNPNPYSEEENVTAYFGNLPYLVDQNSYPGDYL